jgi:hypothetical protein
MPDRRRQERELTRLIKDGVFASEDPQGQINILRQWQREGLVSQEFDTPRQLVNRLSEIIASGRSKTEALQEAGVTLSRSFFGPDGNILKRKVRDTLGKSLEDAWDLVNSGLPAARLDKIRAADWKELQKAYKEIERRLGFKVDIGHFYTSASGAPGDVSAGSAENSRANQAAGRADNEFRPFTQYEADNIGLSSNKVEGLREVALRSRGLPTRGGRIGSPLNPYLSVLLGTTYRGNSSRLLPTTNLEQLNRTFDDFVKQGLNPVAMYDYIRERAGEKINIKDMAKAGMEDYDLSKFHYGAVPENAGALKISRAAGRAMPAIGGAFGIGAYLLGGESPANAATLTALDSTVGQLESTNQRNVQMLNVNERMRPFDPETNTLLDSPNKGLQQRNGRWEEVTRGQGAASRQQSRVQIDQLIPTPKPVMANTPTGVAQLKAMPRSKPLDLVNEAKYFIINPFNRIINGITRKAGQV